MDFFEPFKRFCAALNLDKSLLSLLMLLERKFVVSHLLYRKYEKLFALFRQPREAHEDAFRFGWKLFLVAKSRALSDVPDLVQALHLLLCALSLAVVNGSPPRDAGIPELCRHVGVDAERVEQMRRSVFEPLVDVLIRNGTLTQDRDVVNDASLPDTVPHRSMGLLSAATAAANIAALHAAYLEAAPLFSFDDSQLLREAGASAGVEGTPARKLPASRPYYQQTPLEQQPPHHHHHQVHAHPQQQPQTPSSPLSLVLKSLHHLHNILDARPIIETDDVLTHRPLADFFASCGVEEGAAHARMVAGLVRSVKEALLVLLRREDQSADQRERVDMVGKLFYLMLERLLAAENARLGKDREGFSTLLRNEQFHRSLLWCAAELVFTALRCQVDSVLFPQSLAVVGVTGYDLIKVIESLVRHVPDLSPAMVGRISRVEEQLLETNLWQSSQELWTYLDERGVRQALKEWLSPDGGSSVSGVSALVAASPAPKVSALGPQTPIKGGTAFLRYGIKLCFKKALALCSQRAGELCVLLGMHELLQAQVEKTLAYCLVETTLCRDRHIDTLLLCAIYAVARVYAKCAEQGGLQEITFKEVIDHYRRMKHYETLHSDAVRNVLLADGARSNIIDFYNSLFVPELDAFVVQFQQEFVQLHTPLVTPRALRTAEPAFGAGENPTPAPALGGRSFRNVYVSPMKKSPAPPAPRSLRATRLGVGHSPGKDLLRINAELTAGASASAKKAKRQRQQQQQMKKRQLFSEDGDGEDEYDDKDAEEALYREGSNQGFEALYSVLQQEEDGSPKEPVPPALVKKTKRGDNKE